MLALSIKDVRKSYGKVQALDGVSFDIKQGEFFGLLGPNGAGKTTLISTMAGLSRPDSGKIEVMGHDVEKDFRIARRQLGVVPFLLYERPCASSPATLVYDTTMIGLMRSWPIWI